jgi:hypothetical protein
MDSRINQLCVALNFTASKIIAISISSSSSSSSSSIRGRHTSFFPFSSFRDWGRGTLSLKGGGPILWRLRIPFFSSTGEEWRMEKTFCAKVLPQSFCFSLGVASFTAGGSSCVWTEHKFLPHADSRIILHSPWATIGVSHFLHGEAIL